MTRARNRVGLGVLALVVLSGCSKSTEQICAETDQLLKEKAGNGFTDTGYLGCLKLSAKEAQQSLEGLRENLKSKAPVTRSRTRKEIEALIASSTPESIINEFGFPSYASKTTDKEFMDSPGIGVDSSKNKAVLEEILTDLSNQKTGNYSFLWKKMLSDDVQGGEGKDLMLVVKIKDNSVDKSVVFPE